MSTSRLIGRVLGDRRSVILVSLVALAATLGVAALTTTPNAVGPAMLLPWVALFAFEAGPLLGFLLAAASFVVFTVFASEHGFDVYEEGYVLPTRLTLRHS